MAVQSLQLNLRHTLSAAKTEAPRSRSRGSSTRMAALSLSPVQTLSLRSNNQLILSHKTKVVGALPRSSDSLCFNPLRFLVNHRTMPVTDKKKARGSGAVCYAAPLTARNLQWISTISSVVLLLAKGTAVQKSFLVPLFALQAPTSILSWIKGEYGVWVAFLAMLVRLFFFIPGELELPFTALLLVIVAPYQVMNLRGTQEGAIISLVIAAYMAFQHFSRAGSLQKAFDQGSVVATLAMMCLTAVSCMFLI